MTLKHEGPIFFFSYARADEDRHVARLFDDLCEEVRGALGGTDAAAVGFRDKDRIEAGQIWSHRLDEAVSHCRVFLPLYSPTYFQREYCGQEWASFRRRLESHKIPSTPSEIPLIIPIFWRSIQPVFDNLPESIRLIQYHHPDFGDTYREKGLRHLLRVGHEGEYQEFLSSFTEKLLAAIQTYPLSAAEPVLRIETFPNAFAEAPSPSKAPPRRKAPAGKSTPRERKHRFIEPLREDRGRQEDFLTLVERVCALREPSARIERVEGPESWGDYLRVSNSSGGIASVYPVGAVEQDIRSEDLQDFIEAIDSRYRLADSGLVSRLVYGGNPAPEALLRKASHNRVHLVSFVEYQGLIDFRRYLEKQTRKLDEDLIYKPDLYIHQRMSLLLQRETTEFESALETLQSWLASHYGRFALILGDFGTGKTFLLHELARHMGKSGKGPIPILLQMRSLEKGRSLDTLIAQHFALEELGDFTIPKFRYMLEQGRIALLFDGFDELALRVTYERATEHFDTLLEAARGFAKVVITSRRQHFLSEQQVLTKLGEQVSLITGNRIGILQAFNRDQIRGFLVRHCGSEPAADAKLDLIDHVKDLLGLSANPRMLGFIADLPEGQLRQAAAGNDKITAATLYQLLVDRWLGFEYERIHPKGALPGLSVEDRWRAVTALAQRLWQKTDPSVNLDELKEDAARVIQELNRAFDPAVATFQVGSGTLLIRDDEGNFSFLHQSILEFLVARAAAEELRNSGSSALLGKKDLSLLMIDFLTSLAGRENIVSWARVATRGSDDIAKKNAILVLDRLGERLGASVDLSGQDLSGQDFSDQDLSGAIMERATLNSAKMVRTSLYRARLAHANFQDADLTHADLSESDLAHAVFTRARLLGADLRSADLGTATFERAKLIGAILDETSGSADFFGSALRVPEAPEGMVLFSSYSRAVAWNPKRELLASAEGHLIRLWDPSTGQLIRAFSGHQGGVSSVAFSPDGNNLASASYDHTLRLWDTDSGREIRAFQGHQGTVSSVAFSPDGNNLASASYDHTLRLWDTDSGREIRAFQGHQGAVLSVAFSPDGNTLASASEDKTARLWDTNTGLEMRAFQGHKGPVSSVAFSPKGKTLASASNDQTLRLWDTVYMREIQVFQGHQEIVSSVVFSPEGTNLASASYDHTVRLWDTASGREIRTLQGHLRSVLSVVFSSEGNNLASASLDHTVRLWDTASGREIRALQGHLRGVSSVVFSPEGNTLANASHDHTVRLWDTASGREIRALQGHQDWVRSVAFSPEGKTLASASDDYTVRLWDTVSGREIRALQGHQGSVSSVVFSPEGNNLASASDDNTVRLWDTASGREIRAFQGHRGFVSSVVFSPEGNTLASASYDQTVRLWNTASGREIRTFQGHQGWVTSVVFSPEGNTFASASYDQTVRLWNTASGREIRTFQGHQGWVTSVVFSPQGNNLASASDDNTVRLWDTASGREIRAFQGHQGSVSSVVFSPQGNNLASTSYDNTVRLWDVATGRCIVILYHLPEGWVAFTPDGRYKYGGVIAGGFWHAINLCRFEVGELDDFVPGLRLADDASFFDLPPVPPWVQAKE